MILTPPIEPMTEEDVAMRPLLRETSLGEYLGAKFRQGMDWTTVGQIYDRMRDEPGKFALDLNNAYGPEEDTEPPKSLTKEEWSASPDFREKVEWFDGMTEPRAKSLAETYDARRYRESLIERSPSGGRSVLGFGAMLAAQALDPVNYIPFLGTWGKAGTVLAKGAGTVRAAAGRTALEAMVGTAVTDPLVIRNLKAQGEDVDFTDAAVDILFAAGIGGLFGAGAGALQKSRVNAARTKLARMDRENLGRAMEKALADAAAGEPVDVGRILDRDTTEALAKTSPEMGEPHPSPDRVVESEPPPAQGLEQGERSIGRRMPKTLQEDLADAGELLGFDSKTGAMYDTAEVAQLWKEGKLLPAEEALLDAGNEALTRATVYEKALKVAADCVVRT